MSEVTITVRGEHEARVAPERATIRVTVRTEGPERASVVERVMRLTEPVRDSITGRKESGTIVDWTSTRLAMRAERPWNSEGKRLDPVYYASIDLTATFTEASELSIWVSDISPWDGVEVGWVNWHLTPDTNARIERDVAAQAVGVAVSRAQAYATALGLKDVVPVEIADVGLIAPTPAQPFAGMAKARGFLQESAALADASMAYEPDEIVISTTVEARFLAR
ncbi:SIMPL domain-containing protein [Microbacterium sp. C5A9]|uniref:SIMPL domain-containing protein n=1 Tax=Microbacterium sp. C5A9 TaxID=2736663 RepID=UPI001F518B34|nr:SIMPL domain-containing protein [Microbacterium sp. C5A9]MCI1017851.1 SIMPL domain-containing protein [Microbacterium sp. C5A9]